MLSPSTQLYVSSDITNEYARLLLYESVIFAYKYIIHLAYDLGCNVFYS